MIPAEIMADIVDHAKRDWPKEACGFAVSHNGQWLHLPSRNAYDLLHLANADAFPRSSETAFAMDAETLLEVATRRRCGDQLEVIYHSHTRKWGAVFSIDDVLGALSGAPEPQFPEALYLVVSVTQSGEWMAKGYRWKGGAFRESLT